MSQLNVGSITGNPTVTGNITVNGQVKASSFRHPTASADAISINSSNEVTAINGFANLSSYSNVLVSIFFELFNTLFTAI